LDFGDGWIRKREGAVIHESKSVSRIGMSPMEIWSIRTVTRVLGHTELDRYERGERSLKSHSDGSGPEAGPEPSEQNTENIVTIM